MKYILFVVSTILAPYAIGISGIDINSSKKETDLVQQKIKGPVKTIKEVEYQFDEESGDIKLGKVISSVTKEYSQSGNMIKEEFAKAVSTKFNKHSFKSYKAGNGKTYEYIFNDKNQKVQSIEYEQDGKVVNKKLYKYDDNGNNIALEFLMPKNIIGANHSKYTYEYDRQGNMTQHSYFKINGELEKFIDYKYNERGQEIERKGIDANQKILYKAETKYDESNNSEVEIYNGSMGETTKTTRYDENENIVEVISNLYWMKYTYDEDGNRLKLEYLNDDGTVSTEYLSKFIEFDNYQNWTQKLKWKNKEPNVMVQREFSYYE